MHLKGLKTGSNQKTGIKEAGYYSRFFLLMAGLLQPSVCNIVRNTGFLLKIPAKCLFDFLIVYDIIIGSNKLEIINKPAGCIQAQ